MDNSRKVHQPPAETSASGQIPAQPCRVCGGISFTAARLVGKSGIQSLKPYELVRVSALPGWSELLSCRHCQLADSEEVARAEVRATMAGATPSEIESMSTTARDYYLARLLFAARRLAQSRFTRMPSSSGSEPICADCRRTQTSEASLDHTADCATGAVLQVLDALMKIPPIPKLERRPCKENSSEPANAVDASLPRAAAAYGEPWRIDPSDREVVLSDLGFVAVDMSGSDLVELCDADYAKRIALCVNACSGTSNEVLEGVAAGESFLVRASDRNKFAAFLAAWEKQQAEGGAR